MLEQLYDGMKKYVDLEFDTAGDGIVDNARLGDWVSPEASPAGGNAPEDLRVSATAYLYTMLQSMERSARLLGRADDVAHFAARAATVKAAFNARFLDTAAGYYRGSGDRGYRQTHNVLAVAFGLTPDAETTQRVVDSIAADVRAKGDTLNTGVLGTKYLLPVLTEHGHADLALHARDADEVPELGLHARNGATSMWEHWALAARSRGHYFLGTVDDWFFHHVGGIRTTDGYRSITIAPAVTGEGLEWARTSTRTPYGPVTSDWRTQDRHADAARRRAGRLYGDHRGAGRERGRGDRGRPAGHRGRRRGVRARRRFHGAREGRFRPLRVRRPTSGWGSPGGALERSRRTGRRGAGRAAAARGRAAAGAVARRRRDRPDEGAQAAALG